FGQLLEQRRRLTSELARIQQQNSQLTQLRQKRAELLKELDATRKEIVTRRKNQLGVINPALQRTILDYLVVVVYDASGIIDEFKTFVLDVVHSSYMQEATVTTLCNAVTPSDLASFVRNQDIVGLAAASGIDPNWAKIVIDRFATLTELHKL